MMKFCWAPWQCWSMDGIFPFLAIDLEICLGKETPRCEISVLEKFGITVWFNIPTITILEHSAFINKNKQCKPFSIIWESIPPSLSGRPSPKLFYYGLIEAVRNGKQTQTQIGHPHRTVRAKYSTIPSPNAILPPLLQ